MFYLYFNLDHYVGRKHNQYIPFHYQMLLKVILKVVVLKMRKM